MNSMEGRKGKSIPPGGVIASGSGYLRRTRPDTLERSWSLVPVGRAAAVRLSQGLDERDLYVLGALEQHGKLTLEQLACAYFSSHISAQRRLRILCAGRFVARLEVDRSIVATAVGRRVDIPNAVYVLDHNGRYLLEEHGYTIRNWNPARVARASVQMGHELARGEVWGYLAASARATHEGPPPIVRVAGTGQPVAYSLALAYLNEQQSVIYADGTTGWVRELPGSYPARRPRVLVRPDATLTVAIQRPQAPVLGEALPFAPNPNMGEETWPSWLTSSIMPLPDFETMQLIERHGGTPYRHLWVEVERGTNSRADLVRKIASYNALFARTDMWRRVFGRFPRILVVVPEEAQVRVQAHTWRRHYRVNVPTSVLVTSLERLALAYYDYAISYGVTGGRVLLNYPLWLDVMSISTGSPATNDYWLPLGRALTLDRLLS